MKKIYFFFLVATCFAWQAVMAQTGAVIVTPPTGTPVGYSSITTAYAAIPTPLTGNYLLELSATYNGSTETYPIQLTDKGLTTGGYTITIRPSAGNNNAVIQRPTAAVGTILQFNGADNVILDGRPGSIASVSSFYLTINDTYSGSNTNRNIELINGATNNIIRYVNSNAADVVASGAGSRNISIGAGSPAAGNNSNLITNCVIVGGQRGIQDSGYSSAVPNIGTVIVNDTVRNFGYYGIIGGANQLNITIQNNYVSANSYNVPVVGTVVSLVGIRQQSLSSGISNILNNTISLVSTSPYVSNMDAISDVGSGTDNIIGNNIIAVSTPGNTSATVNYVVGISVSAITGTSAGTFTISRNKISGLSSTGAANIRGMEYFPASGSTLNINNNFIAVMEANANAAAEFGMLFGNTGTAYTTNLYYNSIRVGGAQSTSSTASTYGMYKGSSNTGSVFNSRNNISIIERTGGVASNAYFIGFYLASTAGTNTVNYNTYWASDATNGYAAGGWDGFIYRNAGLVSYKASASQQEQNSNFSNVSFVSATDLHLAPPSSTASSLYGTPVTGITVDIDGGNRSTVNPFQGADEPGVAAPVALLTFTGEKKNTYNLLQWRTATEINNKGFDLERSADGSNFSSIVFIKSKAVNGDVTTPLVYSFTDVQPLTTLGFYRLKQTDNDGKVTYSSIVTINGKAPVSLTIAGVYPNPVVNTINLIVKTPLDKKIQLTITDMSGRSLIRQVKTLKAGENTIVVATASYPSGSYLITIREESTGENMTGRFIK